MKIKLLVPLLVFSTFTFSQNNTGDILAWFDNVTGRENLLVSSKYKFVDGYILMRGQHPFLFEDKFYASEIKYDGNVYYDMPINYDIYRNQIIVLIPTKNNEEVILDSKKIDYFNLANRRFENLDNYSFCEVMSENSGSRLYKKHQKVFNSRVNSSNTKAFKRKETLLLFHKNKYFRIKSRRDWVRVFPRKRGDIKAFYGENKEQLENSPQEFVRDLFNQLTNETK